MGFPHGRDRRWLSFTFFDVEVSIVMGHGGTPRSHPFLSDYPLYTIQLLGKKTIYRW